MNSYAQHHEQPPGYDEATETALLSVGVQSQPSQKLGRKLRRASAAALSQNR